MPPGVHAIGGGGCSTSLEVGDTRFPLPPQLTVESGLARVSQKPPPDSGRSLRYAEVTSDSFTEAPIHPSRPGCGAASSLPSGSTSPGHLSNGSNVSALVLALSENGSETSWHLASCLSSVLDDTCRLCYGI